ncbi:MAG: hypothetical protein ACNA7J_15270, partial [Wenzhouxiangella sp.]
MPRSARSCLTCIFAVVLLAPLASLADSERLTPVTTVEGISEYQLDNGLRILLMPDQSRQTATINI